MNNNKKSPILKTLLGLNSLSILVIFSCGAPTGSLIAPQINVNSLSSYEKIAAENRELPSENAATLQSAPKIPWFNFTDKQDYENKSSFEWKLSDKSLIYAVINESERIGPLEKLFPNSNSSNLPWRILSEEKNSVFLIQGTKLALVSINSETFAVTVMTLPKAMAEKSDPSAKAFFVADTAFYIPNAKLPIIYFAKLNAENKAEWRFLNITNFTEKESVFVGQAKCSDDKLGPCLLSMNQNKWILHGPWNSEAKTRMTAYASQINANNGATKTPKTDVSQNPTPTDPLTPKPGNPVTIPPVAGMPMPADPLWESTIQPLFKKHCAGGGCHNDGMTTTLDKVISSRGSATSGIEGKLVQGEMPPVYASATQKSIDQAGRDKIIQWLHTQGK